MHVNLFDSTHILLLMQMHYNEFDRTPTAEEELVPKMLQIAAAIKIENKQRIK